jgi:hypothetical protein
MVVQCLEGSVDFVALGETRRLTAGTMLYLPTRRALCERGRRQDPQARCRELDRERQPVALSAVASPVSRGLERHSRARPARVTARYSIRHASSNSSRGLRGLTFDGSP